jgi:hypothetical protein
MTDVEERLATLEAEMQELKDVRELNALIQKFGVYADLGMKKEYVAAYTEDGCMDLTGVNVGKFVGHEALLSFVTSPIADDYANTGIHFHGPCIFWVDGDNATGEGYAIIILRKMTAPDDLSEGAPPINPIDVVIPHVNYSHWTFRRVNGTWRVVERQVRVLGLPTASESFPKTIAEHPARND